MTNPVQGVLFDLDGTLLDSNALHVASWVEACADHGFRVDAAAVRRLVGMGGDQLLPALLGAEVEARRGEELREQVASHFIEHVAHEGVTAFAGAEETLRALRAAGVRLALATSSQADDLDRMLRSAGLDARALVDVVVTKSDVETSKPAPDVVSVAVAQLGLEPATCVMVGDTEYDVLAANRAGVRTAGVLTSGLADEAELHRRLTDAGVATLWPSVASMAVPVRARGAGVLLEGVASE